MKKSVKILAVIALVAMSACRKPENPQTPAPEPPVAEEPISTYVYDGKEYPVYSVTPVDNGSQIVVKISPFKEGEKQTTYAVIGINSSLEGVEIDVERAWNNDDYYFIYEDPVMYYSQYRKLQSGTIMMKKSGENIEVTADVILPDGKEFVFAYEGTADSF